LNLGGFKKWGGCRPWAQIVQTSIITSFPTFPNYFNRNWLSGKYIDERMSCEEIAKLEKCSRTTILKYLKIHKIKVRRTARRYKTGCGLAYGEKVRHNRHMRHKKEGQNIVKMNEWRERGYSYRKIARELNSLGVLTKAKRSRWTGKTVWQVLNKKAKVFDFT